MKTLIIKYLNDSISEVEKIQLLEWLKTSKNQTTFKEFVKINHRLNKISDNVDAEISYQKLMRISNEKRNIPVKKLIPTWLKYAAVFVGAAILSYSIYFNSPQTNTVAGAPQITLELEDGSIRIIDENNTTVIIDADGNKISNQEQNELIYSASTSEEKISYNTLKVPFGKTFNLSLADGSKVTLNAGTELKFPINFIKGENRTVFLNGEAYFEVAKDTQHPFIVTTEDIDIEVLGTQFNVTSYADDQKTYAVLVEGKIKAENKIIAKEEHLLLPNEKVFIDNENLKIETVDVTKYVAWVQGKLIFVDDSFKVIANKLERKFNVKIQNNYADLANINITATFTNETIEEVLSTFQSYKNFDYVIKDGTITISRPKKQ